MPTIALQAHFDGERIVLDEKFDLPINTALMVTVLPQPAQVETHSGEEWLPAVAANGAFTFLDDPAEDIYTREDGEPFDHAGTEFTT